MPDAIPISNQQSFWNSWNASAREQGIQDVCIRQAEVICGWFDRLSLQRPSILDVGCGTGWFCAQLQRYGRVVGTDLSDEVLERAQHRMPEVTFVAGDFMTLPLEPGRFDVVVSLEVLSHVADQPAFVGKLAEQLRPGGFLMMATQNRFVLERFNTIPPPGPGQLRRWVTKEELMQLLDPSFEVIEVFTVSPKANKGMMRLVNSYKLNRLIKVFVGDRFVQFKERLGLGWTLMALAQKRVG